MARFNIAMLSRQEADSGRDDDLLTDSGALAISRVSSALESMENAVEEARSASVAMGSLAKSIQKQKVLSTDTAQIAQEMMSYFAKRSGIKLRAAQVALESYGKNNAYDKDRIVSEINLANESFKEKIIAANKRMFDAISYKLSLVLSNNKKLKKEADKVSDYYDRNGAKSELITGASFARIFDVPGKNPLNGKDVVELVREIIQNSRSAHVSKAVNAICPILDKLAMSVSKSFYKPDLAELKSIISYHEDIIAMHKEAKEVKAKKLTRSDVDIEPIKRDEKYRLMEHVQALLDSDPLDKAESDLVKSLSGYYNVITRLHDLRYDTDYAAMFQFADMIEGTAIDIYRKLTNIKDEGFEVAHASVKYIKASTNS